MEIAARVRFRVWLRNVAQVEPRAPVLCRAGFANPLTTLFRSLAAYCVAQTPQNL
jgi:hypothetical protein